MNECIIWDIYKKKFVKDNDITGVEYLIKQNGNIVKKTIGLEMFGGNIQLEWEINKYKAFPYIGKTDINNKKIYADCSIVEFKVIISTGFNGSLSDNSACGYQEYFISKGYFSYCKEICSYYINDFFNESRLYLFDNDIKDIKIIDTIQQNKLGLIK